MAFPKNGIVYSFYEITQLNLQDSPFLQFVYNDNECIIQTSHLDYNELLSVPGMRESLWSYEKTTSEGIPLFWYFDNDVDILGLVDINEIENGEYCITPKGYPK